MRTAGTAATQTSVIEHVGRKSGRTYETPVDIIETATGLLIALPYGARADWMRNVLAAGAATRGHAGRTYRRRPADHRRHSRCGGPDPETDAANAAAVRRQPVSASREIMNLVEPANPPSRKAPLVWAIGAAIPWLMLAVGQVVWFAIDPRLGWVHALAAAVTVLGIVVFVVRRAAVAIPRAPLGHRPEGGVHPHGLAGAGAADRADLAGADRRHLPRPAGPVVRSGQCDGDDGLVGGRGAHRRAGFRRRRPGRRSAHRHRRARRARTRRDRSMPGRCGNGSARACCWCTRCTRCCARYRC